MSQVPLLPLEFGVAQSLLHRFPDSELLVDPKAQQRPGLVLLAAHTVLPEASVLSLPAVARDELAVGLAGPIRSAFASHPEPPTGNPALGPAISDETYLSALVTDLLMSLTGVAGLDGALRLANRVHLARAVRGTVSVVVATACLAWYAGYLDEKLPSAAPINRARTLVDAWIREPLTRSSTEAVMAELANAVAGETPADLLDITV